MKKNLLFLFALICSMSLFTACNNDDEPVLPVETDMAGAYKGELGISVDGQSLGGGIPQKVYISKSASGDNQLKLELKTFMFGTLNLGDIQVDPCAVTEKDGAYSFTGSQTVTLAAPIGACPVNVTGTIKDGKIDINIGVKVEALGQDVVATFAGTKLAGSENTEAKITVFTFDNAIVTEQPVIDDAKGTITFKVNDAAVDADLTALVPAITISNKAVVSPATGVAQDFSAGKSVTYTVIAEDGTVKTYSVKVAGLLKIYTFEDWSAKTSSLIDTWTYEIPSAGGWTGADDALGLVQSMFESEGLVVGKSLMATDVAHSGIKAAKVVTLDTYGMASFAPGYVPAVPKITSGSLFLGSFEIDMTNTLRSTRFGVEYDKEPLVVKGYYKYTPGVDYYRCDNVADSNIAVLDNTKNDECSISAVLYEVSSYKVPSDPLDLSDERLNGTNIYNSPKIVAVAQLVSGAKTEYTPFELKLNYMKPYDAKKLYRFAIIFSSSKDGDKFCGAPGSTLIVDDVEIASK